MSDLIITPDNDILCMAIQNWLNKFLAADGICFIVNSVESKVMGPVFSIDLHDCDEPCEEKR